MFSTGFIRPKKVDKLIHKRNSNFHTSPSSFLFNLHDAFQSCVCVVPSLSVLHCNAKQTQNFHALLPMKSPSHLRYDEALLLKKSGHHT